MAKTKSETKTKEIRMNLPVELHARAKREAERVEREIAWVAKEALRQYLDRARDGAA